MPVAVFAIALAAFVIIKLVRPSGSPVSEDGSADMTVHAGPIQRATLHRMVTAYGSVEPEPAALGRAPANAEVASPVAGIVARVDAVEGQRVAKGDALFRLDSRVADDASAKAKKAAAFAEASFERQQKLMPVDGTSKKAYEEAERRLAEARSELAAAETALSLLQITAPLAGTVVKVNSEPGGAVESNTVLATIIDLDRLVAALNVPSREAALVKVAQTARIEGFPVSGTVVFLGAKIDDKTDTLPVRISIPAGSGLRPGQFLSARILCEEHADCLAVPEAAVIADTVGGEAGTIVVVEGDLAVRKPVRLGLRENGLVEVIAEGLKEGQMIVTVEAYAVPDKARIRVVKESDE